jgi:hypothetical protein
VADEFEYLLEPPIRRAPSRLKSRTYTALIEAQQEGGPLLDVSSTKQQGHALCVFEELVQITPLGQPVKQSFYCSVCHARVLGERVENAPIFWPHCPYVRFQNR